MAKENREEKVIYYRESWDWYLLGWIVWCLSLIYGDKYTIWIIGTIWLVCCMVYNLSRPIKGDNKRSVAKRR